MKILESVRLAMQVFPSSFINHNNEIILIPKFNVYTLLDDVETDQDFKVKLCEWLSRDCCCALRYSHQKRLSRYYQENTDKFNRICGTNFTVGQMNFIYTYLGNGVNHELARQFVSGGFDLTIMGEGIYVQDIVLVHDDYLNYIKSIADHSVDLVVVDPPYEVSVRHDGGRLYANKGITKSNLKLSDADLDLGFDVDKFITSMLRVMKGINIYIWCSKKQIPKYFDIFVNSLGCKFDLLCWHKSNALPTYNNKYLTDTEYLLYFQDGGKNHPQSYADAQTFWVQSINSKDAKKWGHPTIKPLNIIEAIIRNSSKPGDLVLDCFMGSGTTGVACKQLGRSFIGVEINEQFYNIAKSRIDGSCCDNASEVFGLF